MNKRIPKRIIQIWGGSELPRIAKASAVNLRFLNPDFEYLFIDDIYIRELIDNEFNEYKTIFQSFRHTIQRYDFLRYLAVYQFGGFYFDSDILLYKGLNTLLGKTCVFPFEKIGLNQYLKNKYNMHWDIGNYAFGAAPGHPFVRAIIENCVKAQTDHSWPQAILKSVPRLFRNDAHVLYTTGPGLVTRTYAENKALRTTVTILMPKDIHDRANWNKFGEYGIHVTQDSWKKRRNKLHNFILNYWGRRIQNRNIRLSKNSNSSIK